jgi:hypothetical protein
MTVAVPLEAARLVRRHIDHLKETRAGSLPFHNALEELAAFAERFEPQPLPSMTQEVLAGELPELRLVDETVGTIDLIRLNGRVYVPETIGLPSDVIELVVAAREVAFGGHFDAVLAQRGSAAGEALSRLDKASEAFADRVPWDNEPTDEEGPAS